MVVLLSYGRTLPKQLGIGSGILTRLVSTARVGRPQTQSSPSKQNPDGSHTSSLAFRPARSYATASARPASKPKAHTGRTTAKRTTKKTSTKTKAPKAQPKKKKAAKAKPKPKKVKKAPSEATLKRQATKKRVELKERALLHKEPKRLPDNPWTVFAQNGIAKGESLTTRASALAASWKQISPEEREALNRTANENKTKNESAYKRWVQSHPPSVIKDANIARLQLLRDAKSRNVKNKGPYRAIRDDRLVKHNVPAYSFFTRDRFATGDFKGMAIAETGRLVSREWKALSAAERKPYNDMADADRTRYISEYKTVYGTDAPMVKKASA